MKGKALSKKTLGMLIKITAVVLVVAIAAGACVWFLLNRRDTLKVAARTNIIRHWDEQGITKYFEDTLGVKIKWIDYGIDDVYVRVQQDLGKEPKDLPDAYLGMGLGGDQLDALIRQDTFLNFAGMVKDYAENLNDIINLDVSRRPEMMTNGGLYSFPAFNEFYGEEYPQKAWINNSWLVRAKLDMPTTPEELLEVLRAFKGDMNGNGQADEIPLGVACRDQGSAANGTTLGYLVHAFVTTDYDLIESNYLNLNDGKVYAGVMAKEYKDALAYLNTLYTEGLMDAKAFSQGPEVFLRGSRAAETYGVILAKDLNALFNDPERAAAYAPLPPLTNGGRNATQVKRSRIGTGGFLIPSRIPLERQIAALAFGDAMMAQEGTLTVCYGRENIGWFGAEEGAAMGADRASWRLGEDPVDGTALYSALLGEVPYWLSAQRKMERQASPVSVSGDVLLTKENWEGYLNRVTRLYYEPAGQASLRAALPELVLEGDSAKNLPFADVLDYLTKSSRDFVTGKMDLETQWDEYLAALEAKGITKIMQAMQAAYNREVMG